MGKTIDISNKRFGNLTAVKKVSKTKWLFNCDCGKEKIICRSYVTTGNVRNCGCLVIPIFKRRKNIIGKIFGRLTVLELDHKDNYHCLFYKCLCSCGNLVVKPGRSLVSGNTKSCGCIMKNIRKTEEFRTKISTSWFKKGQRPINADRRKGSTLEKIYGDEKAKILRKKYSDAQKIVNQNVEIKNKRIIKFKPNPNFKKGMKAWNRGLKMPFKPLTSEARKNHRLSMINLIKNRCGQVMPNYNRKACAYLNKLMNDTNTYIQHAENGGEFFIKKLGYFVDGYDKINNIVYEFDENYHFDINGNLRQKDIIRQNEIENFLHCKFIRIKL